MRIARNSAARGFQAVKAVSRGQPQNPVSILAHVHDGCTRATRIRRLDAEVREGFGYRIKLIEKLIAPNPEDSVTVLEKRANKDSAQAVAASGLTGKNFKLVAVITVETVLRAEPHESLVVLGNRRDARLGQTLRERYPLKPQVMSVDDGALDRGGVKLRH